MQKTRLKPGAHIEAGLIVPKSPVVKTVLLPSRLLLKKDLLRLIANGPLGHPFGIRLEPNCVRL